MSTAQPIPRSTRQQVYVAAAGQAVFGPLDFVLWDADDVEVWVKTAAAAAWTLLPVEAHVVAPAAPATKWPALFTVALATPRALGDSVWIRGVRLAQRLTDVTRAGRIQSQPLEAEFDALEATAQELRRDVDRLMTSAAATLPVLASGVANNSTAPGGTVANALALLDGRADVLEPQVEDIDERLQQVEGAIANYATVPQLQAAYIPAGVSYVRLAGYASVGDGGQQLRVKATVDDPVLAADVVSQDGARWIIADRVIRVEMFGARADGVTDASAAIQAAEAYRAAKGAVLHFSAGRYLVGNLTINRNTGGGPGGGWQGNQTRLVAKANNTIIVTLSGAIFHAAYSRPFTIAGIHFENGGRTGVSAIVEADGCMTTVRQCSFSNLAYCAVFTRAHGVNVEDIHQYGTGTWFFTGGGTGIFDRIFEVNIANVVLESNGGAVWGSAPWWYFFRAISVNMTNIHATSLDGAAIGVQMEGACEGIFLANVIMGFPLIGLRSLVGPVEGALPEPYAPAYVYLANVAFDQPAQSGMDIDGFVWRFANVNTTWGSQRTNTGDGIRIRSTSYDFTFHGLRIHGFNKHGLVVETGVTQARFADVTINNNNLIAGGGYVDVELNACTAADVRFTGANVIGTTHATGQTLRAGNSPLPSLAIEPTAAGPDIVFQQRQKLTGSRPSAGGWFEPAVPFNQLWIESDDAVVDGAGRHGNALNVHHDFGGAAMKGARIVLHASGYLRSPSSAANLFPEYVGGTLAAVALSHDNGAPGSERGSFFGANPIAWAETGATNLSGIVGTEINVAINTGASAKRKTGLQIVALPFDKVRGSTTDAALLVSSAAGAVGWNDIVLIDAGNGQWPSAAAGALFRATGGTAAKGVDFTGMTFSGLAFASPGWSVSGAGIMTAASVVNTTGGYSSASAHQFFAGNGASAQAIKAGGIVVSDSYADTSPTNGGYLKGGVDLGGATSGRAQLRAAAIAGGTWTIPNATDQIVGRATTDTLTNKTFDTAGAGNSLLINGVAAAANTGTGAMARADSPSFTTQIGAPKVVFEPSSPRAWAYSATVLNYTVAGANKVSLNDAGDVTAAGKVTAGAALHWGASTFASVGVSAGALYNDAALGSVLIPKAGSSSDLVLCNAQGATVLYTPTGTQTAALQGKLNLKSFTFATLPAGAAGDMVFCSNVRVFNGAGTQEGAGVGTGGTVVHNGTAWKIAGTNITAVA